MRIHQLSFVALALALVLAVGTAARADSVPPITPEQAEAPGTPLPHLPKRHGDDAAGATAQCRDGTYSHEPRQSEPCSKHGGVAKWLDGSAK